MKIAIISQNLNPCSSSRIHIELAKNLSKNHQVVIFAARVQVPLKLIKELGRQKIKIIPIKSSGFPLIGKYLGLYSLFKDLRSERTNIISFHATFPLFMAAKLTGKPVIKTYYGTQLDAYLERITPGQKPSLWQKFLNFLGNQALTALERIEFNLSTKVIGISQYTQNEARKLYGRRIPFVYLAVDSSPLPETNPQKQKVKNNRFFILSVSRITPYKGFHHLIQAVKDIQNQVNYPLELWIAGSLEKNAYLDYLNRIKTPKTKLFIDITDEKLTTLYQNCDLYATCDRYPFFGLPLLEAAIFGKPALALDFCAAPEIIDDEKTGLLAKDLKDYRKKLLRLVKDKKLRIKLGQNARRKVKKDFTWKEMAKQYEEIFKKYAAIS